MSEPTGVDEADARPTASDATRPSSAAPQQVIRIECLGELRVTSGGNELSPAIPGSAQYLPWEILAYLASQPAGSVNRERLQSVFWPDVDPELSAVSLRSALRRLRDHLGRQVPGVGPEVVRSERGGPCRLDSALVYSDAHEFVTLARRASSSSREDAVRLLERARALYRGPLLAGSTYSWIDERDDRGTSPRDRYWGEYCQVVRSLARHYREAGEIQLAIGVHRGLLRHEPLHEPAIRDLYRLYQKLGDRAALVREHRQLQSALRAEFGPNGKRDGEPEDPILCEPEPETTALFDRFLANLDGRDRKR